MSEAWAIKGPNEEAVESVFESLKKGHSRFGWSYSDKADLLRIRKKDFDKMTKDEADIYNNAAFLLEIKEGDWIVHINIPEWGSCTAVNVSGGYSFDPERNSFGEDYTDQGDYRHRIQIDPKTIVVFDRNDVNILPSISRRLKLQGRYWRIRPIDDLLKSLDNVRNNSISAGSRHEKGIYYLKHDSIETFRQLTSIIHKHHPGKDLEELIARIFERMDSVKEVLRNGSGWKSDHGADLIIKYSSGLPLSGLDNEGTLVVQVKSYEGEHFDLMAVNQIAIAIEQFKADMGLIVTTADLTKEISAAVYALSNKIKKPIQIISGADVSKLLLRYAPDLIIDL
jgi:hypothetical protein